MLEITLAIAAFFIAFGASFFLIGSRLSKRTIDYPGERSLHDRPIPRNGGLAVLAALFITSPFLQWEQSGGAGLLFFAAGVVLVWVVSFWDDLHSLPVFYRLGVHFFAALLLVYGGFGLKSIIFPGIGVLPLSWLGWLVTVFFLLCFTNLYNFMDGMDGFAGGMSVIGFSFLAFLGWQGGNQLMAGLAIIIASGNLGFLIFNFPPARIFLGDTGSIPMGYLAGGFSLWGVREGIFPLWAPMLIFSPFILDATITFFLRLSRREKIWQAHRSHYYQRLVLLGWGHKKTVLVEYTLMLAVGGSALFLHFGGDDMKTALGFLLWAAIYCGLIILIAHFEKKSRENRKKP